MHRVVTNGRLLSWTFQRCGCALSLARRVMSLLSAWLLLQGGPIGRDLDEDTTQALSEDQVAKLDDLAAAARSASRGGGDDETGGPLDNK